jgi:molybdopterin molybdotransferase
MDPSLSQRLSRLMPLSDVLERVAAVAHAVAPRAVEVGKAGGRVLAADVVAPGPLPARAIALADGWAVASDSVGDASPYAPVMLTPAPAFVETGSALPPGTDAVLPPDAVVVRGAMAEALAAAAPGESVLAAGADIDARKPLRRAGEKLRAVDIAVLRAAGVAQVLIREPRLRIVCATLADGAVDVVGPLIAEAIDAAGVVARIERTNGNSEALERALKDDGVDAVLVIGGTGAGPRDASVRTLARVGRVDVHGIALRPGETAALGTVDARPVLLLPGRLDAALAVWLTVGRALMARLTGFIESEPTRTAQLARKITSTIGLAEIVPVATCEGGVEPLASGYFPLQTLARAEGWIMIAPDSEGYAAGTSVEVMPFP